MQLGEKLRQARLEAGLSQRQLCGDVITRNMLSQIENGSARPSMDTLSYLAGQLGKTVSYFLEEQAVTSPNLEVMARSRAAYAQGDYEALKASLSGYQGPDEAFDQEYGLLQTLSLLTQAEQAIRDRRTAFARELLEQCKAQRSCYLLPELEQRRLLLWAQVSSEPVVLPPDDLPLLIRAEQAWKARDIQRCIALLEVCEDQTLPHWQLLRAEAAYAMQDYRCAARFFHGAEQEYPDICYSRLEQCYRAMENYKMAYEYACRQR